VERGPSPVRTDRLGVTFPFRVFSGREVTGTLGSPSPVRSWRSPNDRPIQCSHHDPGPGARLPGRSSPGVRPSCTVLPVVSAHGLSTEGTSPGVPRPFSARGGESPRPAHAGTSRLPGRLPTVPGRRLRCRSQVFSTSQRPCSSPRRPAVFRRVTLVGFCPTGGSSSHEAPTARRRRRTFLALFPSVAHAPILGGGTHGRARRRPRMRDRDPFRAFKVFVLVKIDPRHRPRLDVR